MIKVNGKVVDITKFPNKESLIKLGVILNPSCNNIILKFEDESELLHLYMIKKTIDSIRGTAKLYIPYMPYSRMDRVENSDFCFTLKYFADFINDLKFEEVTTLEIHSDVSLALFNRLENFSISRAIYKKYFKNDKYNFSENDYVVFPDLGAEKRYSKHIPVKNTLCAIKHRDFGTGKINSLDIIGELPKKPFKAVIIDDLCSYGGTFMLTANKLREIGATEIHLIVAHCENSIYEGELLKVESPITKIYTTDSILKEKEEGFKKWNPQYNFNKLVIDGVIE